MGRRAFLLRMDELSDLGLAAFGLTESQPSFEFHYNPTEYNDKESPKFESDKPTGNVRPAYQYKNGGDRTVSFELFLNDFGQREPTQMSVYNSILWLKESSRPKGIATEGSNLKPRNLLLIRGNRSMLCFIHDIDVKE